MFPKISMYNLEDCSLTNSVFMSKVFLFYKSWNIRFSYLFNLFFRQFCQWVIFSFHYSFRVSSFFAHILHIIFLRSQEQMVRSYARRIIALMKNPHPLWYKTIMYFPGKTMGCYSWFIRISGYRTITLRIGSHQPNPASICFFNLCPKSLLYWLRSVGTRTATIYSSSLSYIARPSEEYIFTGRTYFLNSLGITMVCFHSNILTKNYL